MHILGISCYFHDAASALLKNGELVAAASEERFSRKKGDPSFPSRAISFCLKKGKLSPQELDYVVFYEKPFLKFERILKSLLQNYPRSFSPFRYAMESWLKEKLWLKSKLQEYFQLPEEKILFCLHHLSHAASAFFCSPFSEAAILTVDGVGEQSTATLSIGQQEKIKVLEELHYPHSLGLLYSTFTAYLGFAVNEGEYKVMGMAAYGKPRYLDKIFQLLHLNEDGSFSLDLRFFSYHTHTKRMYSQKFLDLFGPARPPHLPFFTEATPELAPEHIADKELMRNNQRWADIAASLQKATEEVLLKMARYLHARTGLPSLCFAGGVALNCLANYRLLKETPFQELYIQPAAGDAGGALGAALYAYHAILGKPRSFVMERADYGEAYSPEEILALLQSQNIPFETLKSEEELVKKATDALLQGKILGWFQGRFEWGPRALGHRSILADPRMPHMKSHLNLKIKHREPFRPFAPALPEEKMGGFFSLPQNASTPPLPASFMLMTFPALEAAKNAMPSALHIDSTARPQAVSKKREPLYYKLLSSFHEATGVPALINTSFNLQGEPIVNSPEEALATFFQTDLDFLFMENYLIQKNK